MGSLVWRRSDESAAARPKALTGQTIAKQQLDIGSGRTDAIPPLKRRPQDFTTQDTHRAPSGQPPPSAQQGAWAENSPHTAIRCAVTAAGAGGATGARATTIVLANGNGGASAAGGLPSSVPLDQRDLPQGPPYKRPRCEGAVATARGCPSGPYPSTATSPPDPNPAEPLHAPPHGSGGFRAPPNGASRSVLPVSHRRPTGLGAAAPAPTSSAAAPGSTAAAAAAAAAAGERVPAPAAGHSAARGPGGPSAAPTQTQAGWGPSRSTAAAATAAAAAGPSRSGSGSGSGSGPVTAPSRAPGPRPRPPSARPTTTDAAAAGAGAGAAAEDPAAAAARVAEAEAALQRLRQQLAAKEAEVRAKQSDQAARQAAELAVKAAQRAEAERRRAQLSRGLAALAEAAAPEVGEQGGEAAGGAPCVKLARPEDVRRVLGAATDYEVLQLPAGSTAAEVRRAYRRLAASLHPDKCRQEGAQEAFIRATAAYNGLLRRSGG